MTVRIRAHNVTGQIPPERGYPERVSPVRQHERVQGPARHLIRLIQEKDACTFVAGNDRECFVDQKDRGVERIKGPENTCSLFQKGGFHEVLYH